MDATGWIERSKEYGAALPHGSWKTLDAIGEYVSYNRTHSFDGEHISQFHKDLAAAPLGRMGIPICIDIGADGYLQRPEALKLYEMAYFSSGDVLELGTHKGLSTKIMARAISDSGKQRVFETVDIDIRTHLTARKNVGLWKNRWVKFTIQDATNRMDRLLSEKRKFGFIFVDHWHGYKETLEAAERGRNLLLDGGHMMFHDFLDVGNNTPEHPYGVYPAVLDAFGNDTSMKFVCLCGSSAVFRLNELLS
jgi:predicted O-methyltransferase YrrM